MKTITFYSYKGGVGRTLTLSNIATRLSELGKKVCLLDFDLEAPGVPFKFNSINKEISRGIVDYIYEYSLTKVVPESIKEYSITIDPVNSNFLPIELIPAGNINDNQYWKKLAKINWADMFYGHNGQGIKFILDLKAKIENEIDPDILLVDSRTGITDISGITLKILADEVVILSSYNNEGLFGSKKIIKSLLNNTNSHGKYPRINFILTRLPFSDLASDKVKEANILEKVKMELLTNLSIEDLDVSIIHSDRRLEECESQLIGYEYEEKVVSVSNDYLKLFYKLTKDVLTDKDIVLFQNKKAAEKEYSKAISENDQGKKINQLTKAIELDQTKWEYFFYRGNIFTLKQEYKKGIKDFKEALKLNPKKAEIYLGLAYSSSKIGEIYTAINFLEEAISLDPKIAYAYALMANLYIKVEKYNEALKFYDKSIELDYNNDELYNEKADLYRRLGQVNEAYANIYQAISINPQNKLSFATLAEISDLAGKVEDFYFNLNIALNLGLTGSDMQETYNVYSKYLNEPRFIELLNRFSIDVEDLKPI